MRDLMEDGWVRAAFVLVHSLLLGPSTWAPVAARLTASGAAVVVPSLVDVADADPPFWPYVADKVAEGVSRLPANHPVFVVAHSNAGLLVPVIVHAARPSVAGCVFVDATLPSRSGPSPAASADRLSLLRTMANEGRLPPWTTWWDEDDLARLLPDQQTKSRISTEQPRLPLSYYEQLIPAPDGWDKRPCGYLLFGPPYDTIAGQARERGWDVDQVPGRHLHQLVDPDTVTRRIVAMTAGWLRPAD